MTQWLGMFRLVAPFFAALVFIASVPLVDAFFIARLGPASLAAFGYILPLTALVFSVFMGLGQGITAIVARAIGAGNEMAASHAARAGILLVVILGTGFAAMGLLLGPLILTAIGASGVHTIIALEYFNVWSAGLILPGIAFAGSAVLRGKGDIRSSFGIMLTSALVNLLLCPILIFGVGPIPALGVQGAAIASQLAYGASCAVTIKKLRSNSSWWRTRPSFGELVTHVRSIGAVCAVGATSQILITFSLAVAVRLIASFGSDAVSAQAVAGRLESLVMMMPLALGGPLAPVIGMSWGARDLRTVRDGIRFGLGAVACWGAAVGGLITLTAPFAARVLVSGPGPTAALAVVLGILPLAYAFAGMTRLGVSLLIAVDKAADGLLVVALRTLLLLPIFGLWGALIRNMEGMLWGFVVAEVLTTGLLLHRIRRAQRVSERDAPIAIKSTAIAVANETGGTAVR